MRVARSITPGLACGSGAVHYAGIGVRKQTGFLEDEFAHGREIVERARKALSAEEFAGFGENLFGLVAEAEESLFAASAAAAFGEGENFVGVHEVRARLAGILSEGAVVAVVATKGSERDENFF